MCVCVKDTEREGFPHYVFVLFFITLFVISGTGCTLHSVAKGKKGDGIGSIFLNLIQFL